VVVRLEHDDVQPHSATFFSVMLLSRSAWHDA